MHNLYLDKRGGQNWTALEIIFISEYIVVMIGVKATMKDLSI